MIFLLYASFQAFGTNHWTVGRDQEVKVDAATFSVPVVPGWGLNLYWNPNFLLYNDQATSQEGSVDNDAQFSHIVGTINFLPLPVVTSMLAFLWYSLQIDDTSCVHRLCRTSVVSAAGYGVSHSMSMLRPGRSVTRSSIVSAVVEVKISLLLDERTASLLGREAPTEGLWNEITRESFTKGSSCSSSTPFTELWSSSELTFEVSPIRDRQEGSADETGRHSSDTRVAVLSLVLNPEMDAYRYCWHAVVFGSDSKIVRESWYGSFPCMFV